MVETVLAFKGDYRNEFGGKLSRVWRAFRVFNNNIEIGSLYEEPKDYPNRYHVYSRGFETTGTRVGSWYETRKQALEALVKVETTS